jgi:hypothetical protein
VHLCAEEPNEAGKVFIVAGEHEACSALVQISFRNMSTGGYNLAVSTQFLDRLASQLKTGKDAACRRAIERILDVIKKSYEDGQYQNATDAERDFRRLVERDETGK